MLFPSQKSVLDSFWETVQYRLYGTVLKQGHMLPTNATGRSSISEYPAVERMKVLNVLTSEKWEKITNGSNNV